MKLQDYLSPSLLGSILFPLQPRGEPGRGTTSRQREAHLPLLPLMLSNNPTSFPLSYAHLSVNSVRRIKERKSELFGLLFSSDFWASVFKYPPSNLCRGAGCAISEWGEGKEHGNHGLPVLSAPVRTPSPLRCARRVTKQMRGREGRGAAQRQTQASVSAVLAAGGWEPHWKSQEMGAISFSEMMETMIEL